MNLRQLDWMEGFPVHVPAGLKSLSSPLPQICRLQGVLFGQYAYCGKGSGGGYFDHRTVTSVDLSQGRGQRVY